MRRKVKLPVITEAKAPIGELSKDILKIKSDRQMKAAHNLVDQQKPVDAGQVDLVVNETIKMLS